MYDFFLASYVIVNAIPLAFGNTGLSYILLGVSGALLLWLNRPNRKRTSLPIRITRPAAHRVYLILCIAIACGAVSVAVFDNGGIANRAEVFADASNFNVDAGGFVSAQVGLVAIAGAAALTAYAVATGKIMFATAGSLVMFSEFLGSGTRWHLLLCSAPLLTAVAMYTPIWVRMIAGVAALGGLLNIALLRSAGSLDSLASALYWDVPSFQSYRAIMDYPGDILNGMNFIYGQVVVLVPRFVWPEKPVDWVVTDFIVDQIGDAYFRGATILPGLLGSAWLYGGYVGVVVLVFAVSMWMRGAVATLSRPGWTNLWTGSMLYVGLFLQLRNISVFYLMPYMYASASVWLWKVAVGGRATHRELQR